MQFTGASKVNESHSCSYPDTMSIDPESLQGAIAGQLLAVLQVLPNSWLIVDGQGAVISQSDGENFFGLSVLDQVQDRQVLDLLSQCQSTGLALTEIVTLPRTRTLDEQTLRLRMTPLNDNLVLIIIEDLTEEQRLLELRRDFVANLSHELKTPVGAMSLLAEAIEVAGEDPEALANFAKRMKRESDRLNALVTDLIELSAVQDDQPLPRTKELSIDEIVTSALDDVRTHATAKDIEMVVGGEGKLAIRGNSTQIVSALRNLLANAIHYSHPSTRVAVGTRLVDGFVEISVVDQGMGIAKADQERIFERFYRVDPARSRDTGGTGLGLAIVKHVCASHGGGCRVWSNVGDGSTFTMYLPALSGESS